MTDNNDILSDAVKTEIDKWVAKYPADKKQSAVMAALQWAQDDNGGYLTEDIMHAVADYLDMPRIAVYEVASFYSMYDLKPCGRHKLKVCTSISCMLRGSDELVEHIENRLNIKAGDTTPDGKFTLKRIECLGTCVDAPAMQVGKKYHENLTQEKVDALIDSLE